MEVEAMNIMQIAKHMFAGRRLTYKFFSADTLRLIEEAIHESELQHRGEIVVAIEAGLPLRALLECRSPRERAIEVFSRLRVWDTEDNAGVLIYLLLVEGRIEIVADRGVSNLVGEKYWRDVCRTIEDSLRIGEGKNAVLNGINLVSAYLKKHFPRDTPAKDAGLPDEPVIL